MTNRPIYSVKKLGLFTLNIAIVFLSAFACSKPIKSSPVIPTKAPSANAKEQSQSPSKPTSDKKSDEEAKKEEPPRTESKSEVKAEITVPKRPEPGLIRVQPRINPTRPQDEVYLGNWRMFVFGIDDEARKATGFLDFMTNWHGNAFIEYGKNLWPYPLSIVAHNDILAFTCDDTTAIDHIGECRTFEIFIPSDCFDQTIWQIGPLENAVWRYYRDAAMRHGEGWNTHQVDCAAWIAKMQQLYLTENIADELDRVNEFIPFRDEVLHQAFRENQQLLLATRPPISTSENRHEGGTMDSGEAVNLPYTLGGCQTPCPVDQNPLGFNKIDIANNAVLQKLCEVPFTGTMSVNGHAFVPERNNKLRDNAFMGVVSHQQDINEKLAISVFNTQLGNGRPLDSNIHKSSCALTSVMQFDNMNDGQNTLKADSTGVTFTNLFGDGQNTSVYMTSSGNQVVDQDDFWVLFVRKGGEKCQEQVMAVELLGHRQGEFQDKLHMKYDAATEDLFLGLRADQELADSSDMAYFSYTIHIWDGSGNLPDLRQQFASCYLAADPWAYQFFRVNESEYLREANNIDCNKVCPLVLAESAVRSQCFSNSTANQRWQNLNAGVFSMNSIKNVRGNIIINPGWLGPDLDVEVWVQKFDEAVFHGPKTIRRTDRVGQLMVELPTLVEGDRVRIKGHESSSDDYDLIVPCVPEFTGFSAPIGPDFPPIWPGPGPIPLP